ncbi:MAG: SRPBCC family protein [Candidatus Binatia bacterium]
MDMTKFEYVTYIRSSADEVWRALTDGELTRSYWSNHRNRSDWKAGSKWSHEDFDDATLVDVVGTVVESDPPHRLVLTWTMPEHAGNSEQPSRVSFDIVEDRGVTKLTLVHDEMEAGSKTAQGVSEGWPAVLSSLKSLLETGVATPPNYVRMGDGWKPIRFEEATH